MATVAEVEAALATDLGIDIRSKLPIQILESNLQDATYTNYYVSSTANSLVKTMWIQTTTADNAGAQADAIRAAMTSDAVDAAPQAKVGNVDANIGPSA